MPENRIVVAGGNPVSTGTRKVAPNMATTCCIPIPAVRPHDSRSSGRTTAPGVTVLPSPCSSQSRSAIASPLLVDPPGRQAERIHRRWSWESLGSTAGFRYRGWERGAPGWAEGANSGW